MIKQALRFRLRQTKHQFMSKYFTSPRYCHANRKPSLALRSGNDLTSSPFRQVSRPVEETPNETLPALRHSIADRIALSHS
jgi:hypothetical protein